MPDLLSCHPIGYFASSKTEKYMTAKQATLDSNNGHIILSPNCNFEQALEDLEGFERIWLIYWIHKNQTWKPKVLTPRGGSKKGLFATRSPHRPNPIGLSCVELLDINGRKLVIGSNDLLDGTPILDIKPYVTYADAFPNSRQGWLDKEKSDTNIEYFIHWSEIALSQMRFIEVETKLGVREAVELRLRTNPLPFPSHRIKHINRNEYQLAFKTWRIFYRIEDDQVIIDRISSGYSADTLEGKTKSRWNDVPIHKKFLAHFPV